jgi:hypothetical protein
MAHMLKIELGRFENDAAACYDWLITNMMGAAFASMGVPEGPLRLQEDVLLNVIHYLKTAFGITLDSYTSDAAFRIFGVGQGSKAGPVSWARISSLLFQAQDLLGHGVKFSCPERIINHTRHTTDTSTIRRCICATKQPGYLSLRAHKKFLMSFNKMPRHGNVYYGRLAVYSR